jgi:prepilin-type N-terminal cleavage/methylation domain-containing protein
MAAPTRNFTSRLDNRGIGLVELMVTVAIFGILAAIGVSNFDSRREDINTCYRQLRSDLRLTRARAVVSGSHFGMRFTGSGTYQIERLEKDGNNWVVNAVVKTVTLPDHLTVTSESMPFVEFDTRGELVFGPTTTVASVDPVLTDSKFNTTRSLTIYPSGQIHADTY